MSDTLEIQVNYPALALVSDLKQGDSFFYNNCAYTVCQSVPTGDEIGCYSLEDSRVVAFPLIAEVRRVDVHLVVREWTGPVDPGDVTPHELGQYDGPDLRLRENDEQLEAMGCDPTR